MRVEARVRPSHRRWVAAIVPLALVLAACGSGNSGPPRPTDPRQIVVNAIAATAALPALRLHVELAADMGPMTGKANAVMRMAMDADVDLATRQFAGRATTQNPQGLGGNAGLPVQQVSDTIVTTTASYNRDSQTGRWSKFPSGMVGGPTNAQIATMLTNLLSNPAISLELLEASPCTLGTCDHVVAHIDGQTLGAALGPLLGMQIDASSGAAIPNFDIDVRVDQATSVISELRTQIAMGGSSEQILVTISNPGQPVQIVPPPPAITDDFGANFGGGGGVVGPAESLPADFGGGIETPVPMTPEESPTSP
jgi:hypothetical protein